MNHHIKKKTIEEVDEFTKPQNPDEVEEVEIEEE